VSAQVVRLRIAVPAERRRANTIRDVSVALSAIEMSTRVTLPTLGNREAYLMAKALAEKLDQQMARLESLADDFLELAEAEEEESPE
jgi:hypothetical protein